MRKKKIALVTGAGAGIGQAVAFALAEEGYKVYANGRSLEKLRETLQLCKKLEVEPLVFDVAREEEIEAAFEKLDHIDCLVNNAGIGVKNPFLRLTQVTGI